MQFGVTIAIAPSFTRVVQAADPESLQARITETLAELATITVMSDDVELRPFVTSMTLAGGGDGHTFVCTIDASVSSFGPPVGGLDPAQTSVQCFMASQSEALAQKMLAARNEIEPGDAIVGILEDGASGGTRFMGILVVAANDTLGEILRAPQVYFYQEQVVDLAIATADEPVAVTGAYSFNGISGQPPLFTEVSPGILEYGGDRLIQALVRTRTSVRGGTGSGAPLTVLGGPVRAIGGTLATSFLTAQSISVIENDVFDQVTAEAVVGFSPDDDVRQVAIGIANSTDDGDLQVISSMMTIEPLI